VDTRADNGVAPVTALETTVLVAVESAQVREALAAMLAAHDGFRIVAEAADGDQALDLARASRPHLAIVDEELSGHCGPWIIQCMQREDLARVIVAIGRTADGFQARVAGACAYVQMGTPPRDLLSALRAAVAR